MSVESTQTISREEAIERIELIKSLILTKDYLGLEKASYEPHTEVDEFINNESVLDTGNITSWTNKVLEDIVDRPYYRLSMFHNYRITSAESKEVPSPAYEIISGIPEFYRLVRYPDGSLRLQGGFRCRGETYHGIFWRTLPIVNVDDEGNEV